MKCPSCDTDGLTGIYCSNCGAKLLPTNEEDPNDATNSNQENNNEQTTIQTGIQDVFKKHSFTQKKEAGLTAKKIYIFFGIIGVLILLYIINSNGTNTNWNESNYQKGIQSIKDSNWNDAASYFSILVNDNYKDSKILYSYAQSNVSLGKKDYRMAKHYLKDIPSSYNGDLHDQVLAYIKDSNDQKYKIALDLIKGLKYQDAVSYCANDDSLKPFYNIASAMISLGNDDFDMARYYAEKINNYNGYAADEINSYANKILNETTPDKIKARKKSEGVRTGMTQQEVLDSSWGKPKSVNKTTTRYGVHEQWVYGNNNYLYFENGILTTIQN